MAFELPDNLHPECAPIAWLLGTWRGNGHGDYPTIEPFQFGQEVIFTHDGRPFFHYMSRAWIVDADGNKVRDAAIETGFFRPKASGELEVVMTHNTGFVEVDARGLVATAKVASATEPSRACNEIRARSPHAEPPALPSWAPSGLGPRRLGASGLAGALRAAPQSTHGGNRTGVG